VRLGLVSGRPISFQMDLYEPLFVPRPVVEAELFAALRPPTYQGALQQGVPYLTGSKMSDPGDAARLPGKSAAALRERVKRVQPLQEEAMKKLEKREADDKDLSLDLQQGVASTALTTELGEYFEYAIEKPVSLPRQKSALLPIVSQVVLTNTDDERIRFFLRASVTSPQVKAVLEEALTLKGKLAETRARIQKEENALAVIEKDQGRMRANMERVPPTTDAYKRYVKKFDDQETEIEKRRAEITKLQETAEQQQKAYDTFLATLNVE
jgi:hypothetical protein